jgi:acyl carrier protein
VTADLEPGFQPGAVFRDVLTSVLPHQPEVLTAETTLAELGLDSLSMCEVVVAVEAAGRDIDPGALEQLTQRSTLAQLLVVLGLAGQ